MLQDVDGRRVVLVFTDGEDTSSKIGFRTVLERARDEEVMVYAIGLESEYFNGVRLQRTRPSRDLRKIADETGGGYFELKKTDELAPTFTRVAQELRSQYLLGFAPATLDGKVHKLDVRTRSSRSQRPRARSYLATPDRNSTSQSDRSRARNRARNESGGGSQQAHLDLIAAPRRSHTPASSDAWLAYPVGLMTRSRSVVGDAPI